MNNLVLAAKATDWLGKQYLGQRDNLDQRVNAEVRDKQASLESQEANVDGGESAKNLNRLALVEQGKVKTVIIAKLDRLRAP